MKNIKVNLAIYPKSSRVNEMGHLEIGGLDTVDLVAEFGTPLFIYDEEHIRANCRRYIELFEKANIDFAVVYAGKAFMAKAMAKLIEEEGLWLDVSTGGELYTALSAGFPTEKIVFHGNNKTQEELELALNSNIGLIVLDNFYEIELLSALLESKGKKQNVLIRVTPGIIPSTHTYIQTGQMDTKFGFGLSAGLAMEAAIEVMACENLSLKGFHIHIGSQIFTLSSFEKAVEIMAAFVADIKKRTGFEADIINLGGGLGIAYRAQDSPSTIEEYVSRLIFRCREEFSRLEMKCPKVMIEPGRSIVGNTSVTLYRVGAIKEIPGIRVYVVVDGGMSDNLRPMLYGAVYEAAIANKMTKNPDVKVTIAGKHCESGDILTKDVWLPTPNPGDLIVMPATGAYGYAMANNYNRQPRPAVVFVSQGKAKLVIRKETLEDVVRLDL